VSHLIGSLQDFAPLFGQQLVNGVAGGTLLCLLAWALLRLTGKQSSRTRFAVWFSVLLFIAAAPFLGLLHSNGNSSAAGPSGWVLTLPESWALYVLGVWTIVSAVALARLAFGLWQLDRLRRNSTVLAAEYLDPFLAESLEEFRKIRRVELRLSERVNVPTVIGFFRPAIVLPKWALDELSAREIHAVLLHELAHLRRRDDWTNLIQKVLRAILFFHPAVWWIESRLLLEREMACDEMVLDRTGDARGYAQCLVSMAEKSFLHKGLALAQAAVGRMRHMTARISQILLGERPQTAHAWKPALGTASLLVVAALISPHAPSLVAFENVRPDVAEAVPAQPPALELKAGNRIADEISPRAAGVIPAEYKPPAAKLASVHRKAVKRPAVINSPQINAKTQDALVMATATGNTHPAFHEAVFVVVQMTRDSRGFSDGWDVYVIRLAWPSQSSPVNTETFKKT